MHVSSGRWAYGCALAVLTAFLWGILPIKLKAVLEVMDPLTLTWYRLVVSGGLLLIYLKLRGKLPSFRRLGRKGGGLLALAIAGLSANYVLYLLGLQLLTPGTTQLVIQIAPIMLLLASLVVFKERFSLAQGLALLIVVLGFGLFFNQRLDELLGSLGHYTQGVLTIVAAATVWVFYGLSQKQLLTHWSSAQIMMVIYLGCALVLGLWSEPSQILRLDALQGWLLLGCCLNTLVAYGAFAEALAHWEASKVSVTLSITPLITFAAVAIGSLLWPNALQPEALNPVAYFGALLVVCGSALTALGPALARRWRQSRH